MTRSREPHPRRPTNLDGCDDLRYRRPTMPARDRLHAAVRRALERDGWTVTHDSYRLVSGRCQREEVVQWEIAKPGAR